MAKIIFASLLAAVPAGLVLAVCAVSLVSIQVAAPMAALVWVGGFAVAYH